MTLTRRINLKVDLGWKEVEHLQNIISKASIWDDFPARGLCLVVAEHQSGDEDQRIDLLFLRNDGALLPCELKRGGTSLDTHGQLIRYIADINFQKPDLSWLRAKHQILLSRIKDETARHIHQERFESFVQDNGITDKFIRVLPRAGILIDEEFRPQLLKAVRHLNDQCGFSIQLIRMEAFVDGAWAESNPEYFMRIDFVDIR